MKKYLGGILFIFIAVLILIIGIFFGRYQASKNYEKITGTISNIEVEEEFSQEDNSWKTSITFYVNYTYKGQTYKNVRLNYSDSFHSEGDNIDFYVNVDNPSEITIQPQTPLIICIVLSSGFLFVGIAIIIKIKKSSVY